MADGSKGHHEKSQSLDINFRSVRDEINQKLQNAVGSSLTPYIGLERARKILAPYSIFIPATNYMEGSTGVRTFNVVQFDNIVGMTNDGKVETKTESPYHIYFDYVAGGGTYCCRCKLLTSDELEIYMDNYAGSANINEEKDKKDKKEKKVHPLVARVKHAHISDAWMHARRNNDPNFMDTIRAKLKIKGLTVSDDEIKDSIKKFDKEKPMRPHKDKKKDLSEAIARYIERIDEGEKLSRRKSFTIARKFNSGMGGAYAINAAAGAGVGAVVPELGPAAGAAIGTGMTLALHAKDFLKTYRRARKGGYFDGTYEHAKTMKEESLVTESAKALEKQVRTITGQRQPLDEGLIHKTKKAIKRTFGDQKPKERMGKGYLTGGGKRRSDAISTYKEKFGHTPPDDLPTDAIERWHNSTFKYAPGTPGDPAYEAAVARARTAYYKTKASSEKK